MSYSAVYLPYDGPDKIDPSKDGFSSADEAWDFIFTKMCQGCKKERELALEGKVFDNQESRDEGDTPSLYPACSCEWLVCLTEEAEKAEDFSDLLKAGGWKKIN